MGLTIHYGLKSDADSPEQARQLVEQLRQAALDLRMADVGEVMEFAGADCDSDDGKVDDSKRWLLIQARRMIQIDKGYYFATPNHVIAFSAWPGDGCEVANMGLATYPEMIETEDGLRPSGLKGWLWKSFCKTQYASDPKAGGMENFLRCHMSVLRLLDAAKAIGMLEDVVDESHFWNNRDVKALAETVGTWNAGVAAIVGQFKDHFAGQIVAAPITQYPNFEHLEADGRKGAEDGSQGNDAG